MREQKKKVPGDVEGRNSAAEQRSFFFRASSRRN
jgi:hypothetical protein